MAPRLQLQSLLELLLGSTNVYFKPPSNVQMVYPAIRYELADVDSAFADNLPYRQTKRYDVTLMDWDPENPAFDKLASLPLCTFSRHFTADNLNHDVFTLYF